MSPDENFEIGKVEVLMGWKCNCNCIFCSLGHKLKEDKRVKSWSEIKKDIEYAKKSGAKHVSFSGGEPTIRPSIFKSIEYAKELGFDTIEVQTNGRLLYYKEFVQKLLDSGVTRFLISIHAHNSELGDFLMCAKGAWEQAVKGIRNLKSMGMDNIRFSVVLCKYNFKLLPEIIDFLLQFNAVGYHMGFVIPDGYALNRKDIIPRMKEVMPYVKKAVRKVIDSGSEAWVYSIPYCLLQGQEHVIAELGTSDTILKAPDFEASIQKNRRKYRYKAESCRQCRYDPICIGVWKNYVKIFGFDEFRPVLGEKIHNSSVFMKQAYKD